MGLSSRWGRGRLTTHYYRSRGLDRRDGGVRPDGGREHDAWLPDVDPYVPKDLGARGLDEEVAARKRLALEVRRRVGPPGIELIECRSVVRQLLEDRARRPAARSPRSGLSARGRGTMTRENPCSHLVRIVGHHNAEPLADVLGIVAKSGGWQRLARLEQGTALPLTDIQRSVTMSLNRRPAETSITILSLFGSSSRVTSASSAVDIGLISAQHAP